MRKKTLTLLITLLLAIVAVVGCGGSDQSADKTNEKPQTGGTEAPATVKTKELKLAFNQPENHPQYKAMEQLSKKFAEQTNNEYEIKIFPNELLGSQRETIELVQSGTIAMSIVAGSLMENFNQDYAVFNLPYVYDSREHQMSVLNDQEIVGDLFRSTESQGMFVLGTFHSGTRNVYTKKPVLSPADLKGLKIRVMESDTNIKMMAAMGGTGTPMGQGEVYTAIQSGVLDGGENNELIYSNLKHVEVAPHFTYTQHLMIPDYLITNSDVFNMMSAEHQALFMQLFQEAVDYAIELWVVDVETAKAAAEAAGGIFHTVDIKVFQDEVLPLHDEKVVGDTAKALYEKVRQAAK
ncbi:MAG: TRAP transporter substrate-binding protein [Anaerobacillus sp.]|uniref:TRAP transporter substrate-binding protein n=1 Tax=Anaerobacillus sp. TaxID=1872506 RepID=UPI00391D29C8